MWAKYCWSSRTSIINEGNNNKNDELGSAAKRGRYEEEEEKQRKKQHMHVGDGRVEVEVEVQVLFKKELTASDVGKLNRLVIPKRHALSHFSTGLGLDLVFYDRRVVQHNINNDNIVNEPQDQDRIILDLNIDDAPKPTALRLFGVCINSST